MKNKIKRNTFLYKIFLYKFFLKNIFLKKKKSYSQFGEDLIIDNFFNSFIGTYVDVGCYHPFKYNNTMLLYNRGWSGTNIDLNPTSIDLFNISRKRDKNVVACLSNKEEKLNIYFDNILSPLNSNYRNNLKNFKIQNYKKIKTKAQIFSKIIKKKFDFLNIDCEGSDFKILKSIDLNFYRPKLICVEVLSKNKKKIYRYLNQFNYKVLKVKKISHIFVRSTNI